jgi:hypothetical protein
MYKRVRRGEKRNFEFEKSPEYDELGRAEGDGIGCNRRRTASKVPKG